MRRVGVLAYTNTTDTDKEDQDEQHRPDHPKRSHHAGFQGKAGGRWRRVLQGPGRSVCLGIPELLGREPDGKVPGSES